MNTITKIGSVNSLHDLARFIVDRYKLGALTELAQNDVYRKYSELTRENVSPVDDAEEGVEHEQFPIFLSMVKDEAKRNGIEDGEEFVHGQVYAAFYVIGIGAKLYDRVKSWGYSETPTQVLLMALKDKIDEKYQERSDLQIVEDYLSAMVIALKEGVPPAELNKEVVSEIILNIAGIQVKRNNVPLCPLLQEEDIEHLEAFLGDDSPEIKILKDYIGDRDSILWDMGNLMTNKNHNLILDDLLELKEWAGISGLSVVINPGSEDRTGVSTLDDVMNAMKEDKINRINFITSPMGDLIEIFTFMRAS